MLFKGVLFVVVSILIAEMAGAIGTSATFSSIPTWYADLVKPSFSPPSWIFAPAWTLLYALMGIAAYLVWRKKENPGRKEALKIYLLNLIMNAEWSLIFFGMRNPGLALFEILLLWTVILLTAIKFYKIDKAAGILFIPYLLWVSFATILNFSVWRLN